MVPAATQSVTAASRRAAATACRRRCLHSSGGSSSGSSSVASVSRAAGVAAAREDMVALAVTGTLQDGFSMRQNLNWTSPATGETVEAIFAGWGLCRGLKAYLDVKEPGSREYENPPVDGVPYINPACIATGNPLHANVYAVFLVHRQAAFHSLCNLPRYLAMSSDLVRVDLDAEETTPRLRELLATHALREGKSNTRSVAVLAVVATFRGPTFIASPVIHQKADGTVRNASKN
jgi:hypothetical protein